MYILPSDHVRICCRLARFVMGSSGSCHTASLNDLNPEKYDKQKLDSLRIPSTASSFAATVDFVDCHRWNIIIKHFVLMKMEDELQCH